MAAPVLRHYRLAVAAANTWENVVPVIPAGRALVIAKIVVVNWNTAAATIWLSVGPTPAGAVNNVAAAVSLPGGGVYTETSLVALAGEKIDIYSSIATQVVVSVHGEEVDN